VETGPCLFEAAGGKKLERDMGEAKRRRAEIERLKNLSPQEAAAWRQEKADDLALQRGIDPKAAIADPSGIIAMARRLHAKFEQAKAAQNLDDVVQYLYGKIEDTIHGLSDVPVACGQGCSHCCVICVTVSAPEALYVGKLVAAMGAETVERVRAAHQVTGQFDLHERERHPHDCPMLQNNSCTIYENRPKACRQAASADAAVCARSHRSLTGELVPSPPAYTGSRIAYATALHAALSHAALDTAAYEFNAALVRVLETPDAERRWLAGEDIFAGVPQEPPPPRVYADRIGYVRREAFGG
jgi:Fe-S-cluster containining protein